MEPVTIEKAVVAFLSSYLIEGGKAVTKKTGEAFLATLEQHFEDKTAAWEALKDMRNDSQDSDVQASLRLQIKKGIKADEAFAAELAGLLEKVEAVTPATYQAAVYGSGAIAQGKGATAAGAGGMAVGGSVGGSIIMGDGNLIDDHSSSRVQKGGIRASRIEAESVVDGVQMQDGKVEDASQLIELAQAIQGGGITANEIKAGSVVSGLQFLTGKPPENHADLRREVAALRQQLEQAIADGEVENAGDAEDVTEALDKAEAELEKPAPEGRRVVRKLKAAAEILTGVAETAHAAHDVGLKVIKLAPVAAALYQLAQTIF